MRKLKMKNFNYVNSKISTQYDNQSFNQYHLTYLIIFPRTLILRKLSILLLYFVFHWFIAVWICLIDLKITYMKIEQIELGEFKILIKGNLLL